jgi:hypothetical protein
MTAKFEASKYGLDRKQLMENIKNVLGACRFKIKSIDENAGTIRAITRLSLWSWTEKIDIKVGDMGSVMVKSECSLPSQFIDWGKNKRNVNKFFKMLGWEQSRFPTFIQTVRGN